MQLVLTSLKNFLFHEESGWGILNLGLSYVFKNYTWFQIRNIEVSFTYIPNEVHSFEM